MKRFYGYGQQEKPVEKVVNRIGVGLVLSAVAVAAPVVLVAGAGLWGVGHLWAHDKLPNQKKKENSDVER